MGRGGKQFQIDPEDEDYLDTLLADDEPAAAGPSPDDQAYVQSLLADDEPAPQGPAPAPQEESGGALDWLAEKGRALHSGFRDATGLNALESRMGPDPVGSWLGEKLGVSPEAIQGHQQALLGSYDQDAAAAEANPITAGAGNVATSLAMGTGLGRGAAALGAGRWAAPIAGSAAQSGIVSGMQGNDAKQVATDTALGAGMGAGGEVVARGLGAAATGLKNAGLLKRAASSGVYGGDMNRYAQNRGGVEGVRELGRGMEELGLHKGNNPGGKLNPLNWLPQTADTIAENADEVLPQVGKKYGEVQQAADAAGVQVPTDSARNAILELAAKRGALPGRSDQVVAAEGRAAAGRLGAEPGNLSRAVNQKQSFDRDVDWARKGGAVEDNASEQVGRLGANNMRGAIADSLQEQAPDLAQPFADSSRQYGAAKQIGDWASERANKEMGNQLLSLPTLAASGGGLVGGTVAAYDALTGQSSLEDAAGKIGAGVAVGAGVGAIKSRGKAAMAGMLGAAGRKAQLAARLATPAASAAGAANVEAPTAADSGPEYRKQALTSVLNGGRGQFLPDVVERAIMTDPTQLGPYAQQFEGKTKSQIIAQLEKLERNKDWQENYLPNLRQQSAPPMGGR